MKKHSSTQWEHDALAADLAGHLFAPERMVWRDMQLGPVGSPRPDVYTIAKSFVRPNPTAYECKISVSDFRADVTSGKWQSYLKYASCVIFAAPAGLISAKDIPPMCGLILRHGEVWRLAKKPTICPVQIPQLACLKLLIDGVERQGPLYRAKNYQYGMDAFSKRFGAEAGRWVSDAAAVKDKVEHAECVAKSIRDRAEKDAQQIRAKAQADAPRLWRDICETLDIPVESDIWKVRAEIRRLSVAVDGGEDRRRLTQLISDIQHVVARHQPREVTA